MKLGLAYRGIARTSRSPTAWGGPSRRATPCREWRRCGVPKRSAWPRMEAAPHQRCRFFQNPRTRPPLANPRRAWRQAFRRPAEISDLCVRAESAAPRSQPQPSSRRRTRASGPGIAWRRPALPVAHRRRLAPSEHSRVELPGATHHRRGPFARCALQRTADGPRDVAHCPPQLRVGAQWDVSCPPARASKQFPCPPPALVAVSLLTARTRYQVVLLVGGGIPITLLALPRRLFPGR